MSLSSSAAMQRLIDDDTRKRDKKRPRIDDEAAGIEASEEEMATKKVIEREVTGTGLKHPEPGDYARFLIDSLEAYDKAIASTTSPVAAQILARRRNAIQHAHLEHGFKLARSVSNKNLHQS